MMDWAKVLGVGLAAGLVMGSVGVAQNLIILDMDEAADPLTFEQPIASAEERVNGRSLAELIKTSPIYPPIEGLPEEVWAERTCNGCHQWDKDALCTQAQFYLSEAGQAGLRKNHPYGGHFKQALRSWGAQGCE